MADLIANFQSKLGVEGEEVLSSPVRSPGEGATVELIESPKPLPLCSPSDLFGFDYDEKEVKEHKTDIVPLTDLPETKTDQDRDYKNPESDMVPLGVGESYPGIPVSSSGSPPFQPLDARVLSSHIHEPLAEHIVNHVNFGQLSMRLLELIGTSCRRDSFDPADIDVITHIVELWVPILCLRPQLLPVVYTRINEDSSVLFSALHSKHAEIRKKFSRSLQYLCSNCLPKSLPVSDWPHTYFLKLLLENLPSSESDNLDIVDENNETVDNNSMADSRMDPNVQINGVCSEQQLESNNVEVNVEDHFWMLQKLLQDHLNGLNSHHFTTVTTFDFTPLFTRLVHTLRSHKSSETNNDVRDGREMEPDSVLLGLMNLLLVLVRYQPEFRVRAGSKHFEGLIQEIFRRFLFVTSEDRSLPKCVTRQSRSMAMKLLIQFCEGTPENFVQLLTLLNELYGDIPEPEGFGHNPEALRRSPAGFVGLRNLGSTCYMNSLLQQFYMIPKVRHSLLDAEDTAEDRKDSLLFQVQYMFAYLMMSERQAFDTEQLCASYKDEEGNPVNVGVQQDVEEFFNVFTDRIETQLKESPYKTLLQEVFGGKLVNQMICLGGCETIRQRDEPFLNITVEVKNRRSLTDSLESYVATELLTGVNCEACAKPSDTHKRVVLHELAKTMIFHLKRFELNYETFQHEKLNSKFEFPVKLNLEPFTAEGRERIDKEKAAANDKSIEVPARYGLRPREYYEFTLVGVIVHMGNAQAGHYFSYICDRQDGRRGQWSEFNDSQIKPFDIQHLEENCFGGEEHRNSSSSWNYGSSHSEKIRNAYMLVYERSRQIDDHPKSDSYQVPSDKTDISTEPKNSTDDKSADDDMDICVDSDSENPGSQDAMSESEMSISDPLNDNLGSEVPTAPTLSDIVNPEFSTTEDELCDKLENVILQNHDEIPTPHVNHEREMNESMSMDSYALSQTVGANVFTIGRILQAIPEEIKVEIRRDNMQFARDRHIFEIVNFEFMLDLLKLARSGKSYSTDGAAKMLSIFKVGVRFSLCVVARSSHFHMLYAFLDNLSFMMEDNVPACSWLLGWLSQNRDDLLIDMCLAIRSPRVHAAMVQLVGGALRVMGVRDQYRLAEMRSESGVEMAVCQSALLMDTLIAIIPELPSYWTRFSGFFKLFTDFAVLSGRHRVFLNSRSLVGLLGDLFMAEQSPLKQFRKKKFQPMGNRTYPPDFISLLEVISILVRGSITKTSLHHGAPPTALQAPLGKLGDFCMKIVTADLFYRRVLSLRIDSPSLSEIIVHLSYEWKDYVHLIMQTLLEGFDRVEAKGVKIYFDIFCKIIQIEDSLQMYRFKFLTDFHQGVFHKMYSERHMHHRVIYMCIYYLLECMKQCPAFERYLMEQRANWDWVDDWLQNYSNRYVSAGEPSEAQRVETLAWLESVVKRYGGEMQLPAPSYRDENISSCRALMLHESMITEGSEGVSSQTGKLSPRAIQDAREYSEELESNDGRQLPKEGLAAEGVGEIDQAGQEPVGDQNDDSDESTRTRSRSSPDELPKLEPATEIPDSEKWPCGRCT
eukprot:450032_1